MNAVARLLLALLLTVPMAARAESYRVDLIVFLDKAGGGEWGRKPAPPDLRRAIDPADTAALSAAGITVLPLEQFALNSEWQHLQNARRYQPLIRIAWTQNSPPESNGPALHLHWGEPLGGDAAGLLPVDGSVALTAGRYLHLDANLSYVQPANGGAIAFRLREDRLMRRDELHHLDSPKLGILARVSKAGG